MKDKYYIPIAPILAKNKKKQLKNKVHEKGYRHAPITDKQKDLIKKIKNLSKSRIRFWIYGTKYELFTHSVGIARANGIIGLINLTYNLFRYEQTIRLAI